MIRALIFDLDDTLYREKDFVASGYRAVARHVANAFGLDCHILFCGMMKTFAMQGREAVLTALRQQFLNSSVSLEELIEVYRQHTPQISLYPGYFDLLQKFSRNYRLGLITDGLPEVQERKVRALRLESVMEQIIYTWKYGSEKEKPHPLSFSVMLDSLQTDSDSALFIGDNPEKDCEGAHRAGMKCAQILHRAYYGYRPRDDGEGAPEFVIDSLFQLPTILGELN
jgi:putative hydrolase of the HAD superfamily